MDEKTNEAKQTEQKEQPGEQDTRVAFVSEYNKLVSKYGYTIVPVIRLELNKLDVQKTAQNNTEAPKIIKAH